MVSRDEPECIVLDDAVVTFERAAWHVGPRRPDGERAETEVDVDAAVATALNRDLRETRHRHRHPPRAELSAVDTARRHVSPDARRFDASIAGVQLTFLADDTFVGHAIAVLLDAHRCRTPKGDGLCVQFVAAGGSDGADAWPPSTPSVMVQDSRLVSVEDRKSVV